jgi:hypothetical protein
MKRMIAVLISIALPAILILSMGATSSEPSEKPSEIEQLRQEVASLRQRVEALEKQVQENSIVIPKKGPAVISPPWRQRPAPKDWKPFEFNGMPFYIVPIDTVHTRTPEPTK